MSATEPVVTPLAILGGGQLGRMLALAAIPLGVEVRSLDPASTAPAGAVSRLTVGALDDLDAAHVAASGARVVTYEWEGVPAATVRALLDSGFTVHPSVDALAASQDRLAEKTTFAELGIPVAEFVAIDAASDLTTALARLGGTGDPQDPPGRLRRQGPVRHRQPGDAAAAWDALAPGAPLVLERKIPFDRELSIIAVRGVDGDVRTWPLVANDHAGGILRTSTAPAPAVTAGLQRQADRHVRAVLDRFDYVGVLTLELFQIGDELLVNEMAPRVHNSGHWTIEGAVTSQFENHVRAVLGWPLGDTGLCHHATMRNCIGALPEPAALLGLAGVHLHRYGKALRPGRKVGHVTVIGADPPELDARVRAVQARIPRDDG